jgi:hypothetical protein
MRFNDCFVCHTTAEVQCPLCGSWATLPTRSNESQCSWAQDHPDDIRPADERIPDFACLECRIGIEVGRRSNRRFNALTEFADLTVQPSMPLPVRLWEQVLADGETIAPDPVTTDAGHRLVDLIRDLDLIVECGLVAPPIVNDLALRAIDFGPVGDPWWWRGTPLRVVCSDSCLEESLPNPDTASRLGFERSSPLSVWHLSPDGEWRHIAGPPPDPAVPSLAHVSTSSDRIGAWFVFDTDSPRPFAYDDAHMHDPNLDSFTEIHGPHRTASTNPFERIGAYVFGTGATKIITIDVTLEVGTEEVPFGFVTLEVDSDFSGAHCLDVDIPPWIIGRCASNPEGIAGRLADLITATINARFPGRIFTRQAHTQIVDDARYVIDELAQFAPPEPIRLVWGLSHWGPQFLRQDDAQRWAQTWQAITSSTTWGELRHRVPPNQVDWVTDTVLDNSINEHGPLDDRTLIGGLECALMETNTWPWHITVERQTKALLGLPVSVVQVMDMEAENTAFTPDGAYIQYRDGERIAEAMRSAGIVCERNDQLIKQALGPLT